jgi:hypothetical protein
LTSAIIVARDNNRANPRFILPYLVPQTDKPWAIGKGTKKARAEPVPRSRVRKTTMVMIFVKIVISIPHTGTEDYAIKSHAIIIPAKWKLL